MVPIVILIRFAIETEEKKVKVFASNRKSDRQFAMYKIDMCVFLFDRTVKGVIKNVENKNKHEKVSDINCKRESIAM